MRGVYRFFIGCVGVGLIALLVLSCSSDKGSHSPTNVQVSGRVLAYVCGVMGEPEYDHYPDTLPYSTKTGLPAEIEFTSESGVVTSLETNNLSEFGLSLPAGLYSIRIETDYTRPDYFDSVALIADTTMSLVIRYDYAVTDLIYLAFCYEESGILLLDSAGERTLLDQLNETVGGMLLLDAARRMPSSCVLWRTPTNPEYRLWEVVDAVGYQVRAASPHEALRMWVPGYGLCPDDFIPVDSLVVFLPPDSFSVD